MCLCIKPDLAFCRFKLISLCRIATASRLVQKTGSHRNLLSDCWNLYPLLVYRTSNGKSAVPVNCTVGDCWHWYTIQVSFHSSFPENLTHCLSGYGMAGIAGNG